MHGDSGRTVIQQSTGVRQTQIEQGWWAQEVGVGEMVDLQVSRVWRGTALTPVLNAKSNC